MWALSVQTLINQYNTNYFFSESHILQSDEKESNRLCLLQRGDLSAREQYKPYIFSKCASSRYNQKDTTETLLNLLFEQNAPVQNQVTECIVRLGIHYL